MGVGAVGLSPSVTQQPEGRTMIEALKSDEIVEKLGGRFKLTALIQRRLGEIIGGARPLVDRNGRSDLEVVIDEIMQEKITLEMDPAMIEKMRGTPSKRR
jgi:DNA-directed RNA polymerase subunit omega